jgi:hypothetical protein
VVAGHEKTSSSIHPAGERIPAGMPPDRAEVKTSATRCRTRFSVSRVPRASTLRSIASTSGGLMSLIGRPPIAGNASASSERITLIAKLSTRDAFCKAYHRRATTSNVFPPTFRCSPGSIACASSLRASSLRTRASLSVISGYFPRARSFSLSANRYLKRQSFPPAGVTRRNKPRPSNSFTGRSLGLAARTAVSESGIIPQQVFAYPELYPHQARIPVDFPRSRWTRDVVLPAEYMEFLNVHGLRRTPGESPRQESNLYPTLRRRVHCPLCYEESGAYCSRCPGIAPIRRGRDGHARAFVLVTRDHSSGAVALSLWRFATRGRIAPCA